MLVGIEAHPRGHQLATRILDLDRVAADAIRFKVGVKPYPHLLARRGLEDLHRDDRRTVAESHGVGGLDAIDQVTLSLQGQTELLFEKAGLNA